MITGPKLETRTEQLSMSIRAEVAMQDLGSGIIPRLHSEVAGWLGKQGQSPAGAPFIRYVVINMTDKLVVELGWPVAKALQGDGRVVAGAIPAGRYASLVYTGDYSGLMDANRVLIEWGAAQGLTWDHHDTPKGDAFEARYEFYLTDPGNEPDPAKWETEVAIRLAPDSAQTTR